MVNSRLLRSSLLYVLADAVYRDVHSNVFPVALCEPERQNPAVQASHLSAARKLSGLVLGYYGCKAFTVQTPFLLVQSCQASPM